MTSLLKRLQKAFEGEKVGIIWDDRRKKFLLLGSVQMPSRYTMGHPLRTHKDGLSCN